MELLKIQGGNFIWQNYPLQDLLSSLIAVTSTNERLGHVTFKLCYNQI